jgi:hypothetical protein
MSKETLALLPVVRSNMKKDYTHKKTKDRKSNDQT